MNRRLWIPGACVAASVLLASGVLAGPAVKVIPAAGSARLMVAGKLVTIFRTANRGLSPRQRADLAAERLARRIASGLSGDEIEARAVGENWGVYASGTLVMVATREEAAERREEPETTARRWVANLQSALAGSALAGSAITGKAAAIVARSAVPQGKVARGRRSRRRGKTRREPTLAIEDASVAVPVGERRLVALKGTARGEIGVSSDDRDAATVRTASGKAAVEVRGAAPGKAVVHVTRQGKEASFTVWVKKYAGRIGATSAVEVTGSVAPVSLLKRLARERALEAAAAEPGAVVDTGGAIEGLKPLPRGMSADLAVPIAINGDGFFSVRTTARVRVRNVALPAVEPKLLLYSNDPESVRRPGALYAGLAESGSPVRLLYHHQNRFGKSLVFQIHLVNPTDSAVKAQVIEGDAGPFIDPIQVGHRAAARYMSSLAENVGYLVQVPARGSLLVYAARVPNDETVSGIDNFRVLEGGPVVVHVAAETAISSPEVNEALLTSARNAPHTYATTQMDERYSYTVGMPWTFIPLGRKAITTSAAGIKQQLFGNYGVLYNVTVDVNNPTDESQTVRVVLSPEAGWARGVFIIEGKMVEAPQVAPPADAVLWSFKLGPQQQRRLNIQGIPVGGSAYPVSIVVRS